MQRMKTEMIRIEVKRCSREKLDRTEINVEKLIGDEQKENWSPRDRSGARPTDRPVTEFIVKRQPVGKPECSTDTS